MPYELIMLLGFFGTVLLSLLPEPPARDAGDDFRGRRPQRRSDGRHDTGRVARRDRTDGRSVTTRRRDAGRAVA